MFSQINFSTFFQKKHLSITALTLNEIFLKGYRKVLKKIRKQKQNRIGRANAMNLRDLISTLPISCPVLAANFCCNCS